MPEETTTGTIAELSQQLTRDVTQALRDEVPDEPPPQDPVLASLAQWAGSQENAPAHGQVIEYLPDGSFGMRSRQEIAQEVEKAEMNMVSLSRIAGQLDGSLGADIPWGAVAIGAVPGVILGEVIDGLSPPVNAEGGVNATNIVLKGVSAFAAVQFGKGLLGKRPSQFFAGALLVQILADVLPLNKVVAKILDTIKDPFAPAAMHPTAVQQAERVVRQATQSAQASDSNPYDDIF